MGLSSRLACRRLNGRKARFGVESLEGRRLLSTYASEPAVQKALADFWEIADTTRNADQVAFIAEQFGQGQDATALADQSADEAVAAAGDLGPSFQEGWNAAMQARPMIVQAMNLYDQAQQTPEPQEGELIDQGNKLMAQAAPLAQTAVADWFSAQGYAMNTNDPNDDSSNDPDPPILIASGPTGQGSGSNGTPVYQGKTKVDVNIGGGGNGSPTYPSYPSYPTTPTGSNHAAPKHGKLLKGNTNTAQPKGNGGNAAKPPLHGQAGKAEGSPTPKLRGGIDSAPHVVEDNVDWVRWHDQLYNGKIQAIGNQLKARFHKYPGPMSVTLNYQVTRDGQVIVSNPSRNASPNSFNGVAQSLLQSYGQLPAWPANSQYNVVNMTVRFSINAGSNSKGGAPSEGPHVRLR